MEKSFKIKFAIGFTLVIAIIIGSAFYIFHKKQEEQNLRMEKFLQKNKINLENRSNSSEEKNSVADSCQSKYYEGESEIRGWAMKTAQSDKSIIVRVENEDILKLPARNTAISSEFTVRLIDPTETVRESLLLATEKKPATINIKGYAEICEQEPPQISLKEASIAFKKS